MSEENKSTLGTWNSSQIVDALGPVNKQHYNKAMLDPNGKVFNPRNVVHETDPAKMTVDEMKRLLYWYIGRGGSEHFARENQDLIAVRKVEGEENLKRIGK